MSLIRQILVLSTCIFSATAITFLTLGQPNRQFTCDPKSLKENELCLAQAVQITNPLWVDARHRSDWNKNGHPDAILFNLDSGEDMNAFEAEIALKSIENPHLIIYCGDENCGLSKQVADRIRKLGLGLTVSTLKGGWRALNDAKLTKETKDNH